MLDAGAAARAALDGDVRVGGAQMVQDAQVAGDMGGVQVQVLRSSPGAPGRPRSVGGRFMSHFR